MQILLSCAKTMAASPTVATPPPSRPKFETEAAGIAARLATLAAGDLGRLLRVNSRLAAENRRRYLDFHDRAEELPALTAYTGIVFRHIDPASFTGADFAYAQRHLNIASFLYGLLRPLDAIRPYRLEGDAAAPGSECTMFDFWRPRLTDTLLERIRHDDGVLVNLASAEMKRLFDWERLRREVRIITPEFRIRDGERLRTVVVYTKMCRGEMTRRILRERLETPDRLSGFDWEGFRFVPELGGADSPVFVL